MGSRSYFSVWSTGNSLAIASRCFFSVWSTGNACGRAFPSHSFFFPVDQPGKKSFRRNFFLVGLGRRILRTREQFRLVAFFLRLANGKKNHSEVNFYF
jgi:hypothetical protein